MEKLSIYDINAEIYNIMTTDYDDAEQQDQSLFKLDELLLNRDEKIENVGLCVKSFTAIAEAIKAEEQTLVRRRKAIENNVERCKNYISFALLSQGENKFMKSRIAISFRKSESINITDESIIPDEFKKEEINVKIDKIAIKQALREGEIIPGVELIENQNIQIK